METSSVFLKCICLGNLDKIRLCGARVMGVLERELHGARAKLTDTSTRNKTRREGDQGQTPGARELRSPHACSKHRRFPG